MINDRKWAPTQTIKALAKEVNSREKWEDPVSADTVMRAIDNLHSQTSDRRFERLRRQKQWPSTGLLDRNFCGK